MRRERRNGVIFFASDLLPGCALDHGFTTRHGGASPAPFDSLNLSLAVGDSPANVEQNLTRLYDGLGVDRANIVTASQAQADTWARVGVQERGSRVANVDALLTETRGTVLLLRFADCVPILLYDPLRPAVAVVHAGWRGTTLRLVEQTVKAMNQEFGSRPVDLHAVIGPSIGPCCYRVGQDLVDCARSALPFAEEVLIEKDGGHYFDLWRSNQLLLQRTGVMQIDCAEICTAHHTDDFYSWRAEQQKTGRFAALIGLK